MRHYERSRYANLFTQNLLWIGAQAWQGYLNLDRGVVVISSEIDLLDDSNPHWEASLSPSLNFRYIPQAQLAIYLQEWLVHSQAIDPILTAVATYEPQTELMFAIEFSSNLDLGWCQRLKISPPDCYQQICRRWSEFQIESRG